MGPDGAWRDDLWLDGLLAETTPVAAAAEARPVLTTPLPINTCSRDSLTLLPRVGPVLAGRIAEARLAGLIFRTPADLEQVKGIGPMLSARLAPLVIFAPDSLRARVPAPAGANAVDTTSVHADSLSATRP